MWWGYMFECLTWHAVRKRKFDFDSFFFFIGCGNGNQCRWNVFLSCKKKWWEKFTLKTCLVSDVMIELSMKTAKTKNAQFYRSGDIFLVKYCIAEELSPTTLVALSKPHNNLSLSLSQSCSSSSHQILKFQIDY